MWLIFQFEHPHTFDVLAGQAGAVTFNNECLAYLNMCQVGIGIVYQSIT